ncbi:hypothetical protein N0V95_008366 [Ascochyta clinopodiicola]|nr:hypothetical protein N0V95_008366 [Ascochyta clinopodiicola]
MALMWLNTPEVKTVITFNLPYQHTDARKDKSLRPCSATCTVYRAPDGDDGNLETHEDEAFFCTTAKEVVDGQLELTLNNFLPDTYLLESGSDRPITVSHGDLTSFLVKVLDKQVLADLQKRQGLVKRKKAIRLKRLRSSSPCARLFLW